MHFVGIYSILCNLDKSKTATHSTNCSNKLQATRSPFTIWLGFKYSGVALQWQMNRNPWPNACGVSRYLIDLNAIDGLTKLWKYFYQNKINKTQKLSYSFYTRNRGKTPFFFSLFQLSIDEFDVRHLNNTSVTVWLKCVWWTWSEIEWFDTCECVCALYTQSM